MQCLVGEGAAGVRLGHWQSVNKRARGVPGVAVGARGCKEEGNGGDDCGGMGGKAAGGDGEGAREPPLGSWCGFEGSAMCIFDCMVR